jgi:hypothetical protein
MRRIPWTSHCSWSPGDGTFEIVEFWLTDDQRRRVRMREAPIYELSRGASAISGNPISAEAALQVAAAVPAAPAGAPELALFTDTPV